MRRKPRSGDQLILMADRHSNHRPFGDSPVLTEGGPASFLWFDADDPTGPITELRFPVA